MPVAVGDVLQVTFVGSCLEQRILNTFHYGVSTLVGTPTQTAFATEVLTKLNAAAGMKEKFLDCVPNNYSLDHIWVQFILDTRYRKTVGNNTDVGGWGSNTETSNLAAVISRFGPAANRRNQGSVHILISSDDAIDGGEITGGMKTALTIFAPFLYNPLTLATLGTIQPILIHGTSRLNAVPLSTAEVQTTVRTMRRRTVGRGV